MSPETSIVKDSSEKKIKVPNLQDVQNNFKSKTSVNKLFQHSSISKSNSESDLNFGIDWDSSFATEFNAELDVLYTPLHFNSTKRLKSFIASATINDTLVSQIVTLAYVGQPNLEYFNGYIFFHELTGAFKSSSYYEFGEKIKTSYPLNTKQNSTNKGSCAAAQFEYILEYGLDRYEDFFGPGLCTTVTVAEISSSDGGGGGSFGGGNNDFPPSGGMYIPTYGGGGGGSSSPNNNSTPPSIGNDQNESVSTLESAPYWQETIAPNESVITTLATELNLTTAQSQWLQNTQNNIALRLIPFQVSYFLDQNLWSSEAKNFVQEAIGVLIDGGEVDFEDRIILDANFISHPRLKCVYEKFKSGSNTIADYLNNFLSDNAVAHLNLSTDDNFASNYPTQQTAGAITAPPINGANGSDVSGYNINVVFNTDASLPSSAQNYPTIILAQELVHEMVHAEMYRKLLECANLPHVNFYDYTNEEWRNFVVNLRGNYGGIYDYYERYYFNNSNPNATQHNAMASHYRSMMGNALKDFDNNQHSDAFYNAIAWMGLKGTKAWNDPSVDQAAINSIINNAVTNETHTCTN